MNNYVFKDEFADNLPPDVPEIKESETEQMPRGEGCLRLVFIQGVICVLIVLSCLALRYAAPKAYASIKTAYNNAVKTEDITLEDIKAFFSSLGSFVFSDEKPANSSASSNIPQNESSSGIAQSEGAGGSDVKVLPSTVTEKAYLLTSSISAPAKGTVTSEFGWRIHPVFKTEGFHTGIDIASKLGTPITSAFSGVVYEVGQSEAYGNYVIMKHSDTLFTFYGHCDSVKVEKSMVIRAGEIIAYMGSTGYSTGPHLHFEIRINGKSVDPAYVLKGIDGIEF
ncbi:MAG: M23 family metallopeptidase [Oscillospiraceae bacterium]|nr:M23 family metallopeptidase [Oscillospiraceae bacterium]